jgi:phospholipid/cholesterol/gamma-HCH transport system substrate-binding protein
MENKAHALAAGAFVLVITLLLAGLTVWLTRDNTEHNLFEMSTSEPISGLQVQAAVRYRGVPVGKVEYIGFDTKVRGNVLVRIAVERGAPVTTATFATIESQGVTGLGFVQLDDNGEAATPLTPNDSDPPRIPLQPGFLDKLKSQSEIIFDQLDSASKRLNSLLSDDNQKALVGAVQQMGEAAGNINKLALRLDGTITRRVDPALKGLEGSTAEISKAASEVGKVAQRLGEKDGAIDRLSAGSDALARSAQNFNAITLPRINRATDEVTRGARQVNRAANALGDNPRSLLFGNSAATPGPGEPGFAAPSGGAEQPSTR